jgi:hypothetical protein
MTQSTRLILGLSSLGLLVGLFQNCAKTTFSSSKAAQQVTGDGTSEPNKSVTDPNAKPPDQPVICDPFSGTGKCDGGVTGYIYALTPELRAKFGDTGVNTYLENGQRYNVLLKLSQLFIPTRPFDTGFPTSQGEELKTPAGEVLIEYFAMKLRTVLKLNQDTTGGMKVNAPGYYQFAVLSDDGSRLEVINPAGEVQNVLIDNDGSHATEMGCSKTAVYLDATTRMPLQILYYQGPRLHIALSMLWRKVDRADSALSSHCGESGNGLFFGDKYDDFSNHATFGKLLDEGWAPVGSENFNAVKNF